jgi:DNA-binding NtrC family response regulator
MDIRKIVAVLHQEHEQLEGAILSLERLARGGTKSKRPARAPAAASFGDPVSAGPPSLREIERSAIFDALAQTNGVLAPAAAMLGIGRTTLYRRMKEFNRANPNQILEPGCRGAQPAPQGAPRASFRP